MTPKIVLTVIAVLVLAAIGFVLWVLSYPQLSKIKTAGGLPRNQSQYLTMRDGVKIAVDIWFPQDFEEGDKIPALIKATRYSRGDFIHPLPFQLKLLLRRRGIEPSAAAILQLDYETVWANEAGYAVMLVDARGSAASFGTRPIEWSPDEVADYGEIIAWISSQPWSNGKVGAWGTSYPGNTAELMTSTGEPAFLATAPRFDDFDPLLGVGIPGGLRATGFLEEWSELNATIDHDPAQSKPVQDDKGGKLLQQAIAGHDNPNIAKAMGAIEYRDDVYAVSGLTCAANSPYAHRKAIEARAVPMQVWVSWLDAATMDGALSRYLTFSNPQHLIIGACDHGGSLSRDPFMPPKVFEDAQTKALAELGILKDNMTQVLDFFDCYLKDDASCPELTSHITYYTLNSGEWQTTTVWPPEGFVPQHWYFAADGALSSAAPVEEAASDDYTVDFSATTGESNRWMAQMGHSIDYTADRAAEDAKLLTYTSAPLPNDTEITGSPIVTFYVASTEQDGAFHVYLEDVAPDGKVTYITEGVLRAIHHPISDDMPPYTHLGPYHSYNRADARPLVPGQVTEISLNLYATSVLIKAGHSLRVALAGADTDTFDRYPAAGTPVWTVHRSSVYPSHIELPMAER